MKKNFLFTCFAGLNSIYTLLKYKTLKGSDSERIMSDVIRVGEDFKRVLNRDHGKTAA